MSKPANPRRLADNEAKATIRMLRVSPQKLGRAGRIEKPFSNITLVVREVAANAADAA